MQLSVMVVFQILDMKVMIDLFVINKILMLDK